MLAIAFAAVMLVAGQLYIQSRPERLTAIPVALTASVPVGQAQVNLITGAYGSFSFGAKFLPSRRAL